MRIWDFATRLPRTRFDVQKISSQTCSLYFFPGCAVVSSLVSFCTIVPPACFCVWSSVDDQASFQNLTPEFSNLAGRVIGRVIGRLPVARRSGRVGRPSVGRRSAVGRPSVGRRSVGRSSVARVSGVHVCPVCTGVHQCAPAPVCTGVHRCAPVCTCVRTCVRCARCVRYARVSSAHDCTCVRCARVSGVHVCPVCTCVLRARVSSPVCTCVLRARVSYVHVCARHVCPPSTCVLCARVSGVHVCPLCTCVRFAPARRRPGRRAVRPSVVARRSPVGVGRPSVCCWGSKRSFLRLARYITASRSR